MPEAEAYQPVWFKAILLEPGWDEESGQPVVTVSIPGGADECTLHPEEAERFVEALRLSLEMAGKQKNADSGV